MDAFGAIADPAPRHFGGVVGEHRDIVEITLAQADALAVLEVNRWDQEHDAW